MNIFIDTNIFLSFYHLTSDDLQELEKLVVLIKNKEITLYLPEQVVDETIRNRASKISDSLTNFKKSDFKVTFPSFCKNYPEYEELRKSLKNSEILHSAILKKAENDIEKKQLKADELINNLFSLGIIITRTNDIVSKAELRRKVGNPPGKSDSLGDAINWESLLSHHTWKNICIITDDSDFYSKLDSNSFNEFLELEWERKKEGKITFYRKLSDFFRAHYSNINLKAESEKDTLIEQLSSSVSFAQTHALISNLSKYEAFTQKQTEDLMIALLNNSQINWIVTDKDVFDFYEQLNNNSILLFEEKYKDFQEMLITAKKFREESSLV